MNIESLNRDFGIDKHLTIDAGNGGFPVLTVDNGKAQASISLYAGQVLSYRPSRSADDLFFLSDRAYYAPGKAIKGGVPICWPWFGPDPQGQGRPAHGFVRNRPWQLVATAALGDGATRISMGLSDDADSRQLWPHAFELTLEVTVGDRLTLTLTTANRGAEAFTLSQALHSYFQVGDIHRVTVEGLDGHRYLDKMDHGVEKRQQGPLAIDGEVDRIYTGVGGDLAIDDPGLGRRIGIHSAGSASAVVWNPWSATAAAMADLGDDDYRRMLCVETCNAGPDLVEVAAGGEHRLVAEYWLDV